MTKLLRGRVACVVIGGCVLTFVACVVSDFSDGQYTCDPTGEAACPPGLLCAHDGFCRSRDLDDGAPPPTIEASIDANDGGDATAAIDADNVDACSSATWVNLTDARAPLAIALSADGRLFAGGSAGTQAWVAEVDTCDGGIIRELVFDVADTTKPGISGILATGSDLAVAGGADQPNAVSGHIGNMLTLASSSVQIVAGLNISTLGHPTLAGDGIVWLAGAESIFAPSQVGWLYRTSTQPCQLTLGTSVAVAAAPAGSSGSVYAMQNAPGVSSQLNLVDSACALGAMVGSGLSVGTDPTVVTMLSPFGKLIAVGGASGTTPNTYAFFSQLDLASGDWTTTTLDPNPMEADVLQDAVSDAKGLYLGVNQRAGFGTGTATVYRYDPPLSAASKPAVVGLPFGAVQIGMRALAVAPAGQDGLYVAGATLSGAGGIARCRKSGVCAP